MLASRTLILILLAVAAQRAEACEPILPLMLVLGGPLALTRSAVVLLVAVILKAAIFTALQAGLAKRRAFLFMVAGNVLTTVIGFLVAAAIASTALLLFAL